MTVFDPLRTCSETTESFPQPANDERIESTPDAELRQFRRRNTRKRWQACEKTRVTLNWQIENFCFHYKDRYCVSKNPHEENGQKESTFLPHLCNG